MDDEPLDHIKRSSLDDEWEIPMDLDVVRVPPFPVDALPDWLALFCRKTAWSIQVPVDMVAMMCLAVLSTAVAGRFVVQVQGEYCEQLNLWIVVAMGSGNRKSETVRIVAEPIRDWCKQKGLDMSNAIAEATSMERMLEQERKLLEAAAAKEQDLGLKEEAMTKAKESSVRFMEHTIPKVPRMIAQDVTSEALVSLLHDHKGRMALISPEGDIFELMKGRYSNNIPNINVYLQAYTGDTIEVDRQHRPPAYIEKPTLTMGVSPQPEALRGLTSKPEFTGRGLLARFLYSLPVSLVGYREVGVASLTLDDKKEWSTRVQHLLDLYAGEPHDPYNPHILSLSDAAYCRFLKFHQEEEVNLREGRELAGLHAWGGKFHGSIARLVGVLHMATHADSTFPDATDISDDTMTQALMIGAYLVPHAKSAFNEMGSDEVRDHAKVILSWIRNNFADKENNQFTGRDCFRACHRCIERRDDLDEPLALLVEYGFIREATPLSNEGRRGRKSRDLFSINPHLFRGNVAPSILRSVENNFVSRVAVAPLSKEDWDHARSPKNWTSNQQSENEKNEDDPSMNYVTNVTKNGSATAHSEKRAENSEKGLQLEKNWETIKSGDVGNVMVTNSDDVTLITSPTSPNVNGVGDVMFVVAQDQEHVEKDVVTLSDKTEKRQDKETSRTELYRSIVADSAAADEAFITGNYEEIE